MALHKDYPESLYVILDMNLLRKAKEWRGRRYVGTTDTSKSLLNWWFSITHLLPWTAIPPCFLGTGERVCAISIAAMAK